MCARIPAWLLFLAAVAPPVASGQATLSPLPGIVRPGRRVEMIAQSDGLLKNVAVKEGQAVRSGQVVAQFDATLAMAAIRVAEAAAGDADMKLARVDLKLAKAELARLESVPDRRALAGVEIDRARAAVERAEAAVEQAIQDHKRANSVLALERARMKQLTIRAPFDGVVVRVQTQSGASLIRSAPLLTIADLSTLRVEMFVALEHFRTIRVGQRYQLHASAPVDRTIVGQLMAREPVINAATGTFRCVFEITNSDGALPAGFTVQFRGERASPGIARKVPHDRAAAR